MRALRGIGSPALTASALSSGRTRSVAQMETILAQCLR